MSRPLHALAAFAVRHVRVTSRTPADPGNRSVSLPDADSQDLHHYQDLADALHDNAVLAAGDHSLGVANAQGIIERTLLRLDQAPSGLLSLAAQDNVDRFTVGHSVRVALLALQVARAAGAQKEQLVDVGIAALLHDIGKAKVPPEILWKRGKLDEQEWVWMSQHPRLGADILLEQDEVMPSAVGAIAVNTARAGVAAAGQPIVGFCSARIFSSGTTTSASCANPPMHNDHDRNLAVASSPAKPSGSAT